MASAHRNRRLHRRALLVSGDAQFGESADGDTNTSVTNCGSDPVRLAGRVSKATGLPADWQPLEEQRAVTCADGADVFSYRLADPFSREGLGVFLGIKNRELERGVTAGAVRHDAHTLFMPCPGSSGEPDELVSMTVLYTGTQA